jgi:hypothetical protein
MQSVAAIDQTGSSINLDDPAPLFLEALARAAAPRSP